MNSDNLTDEQKAVIEKVGVMYQKTGLSPAAARILSLLMVVDEAELTFEEICSALHLSKSAVSTAINSLLLMERIDFHTKPGDRKRYFFVDMLKYQNLNEGLLKRISNASIMYREILSIRSEANPKYNADLKSMIEFTDFLFQELSEVFKKWKKDQ
ncbi:hypothetical protein C3K47_04995 [Solitalea longa]|uniref:HTH marR-type domain-containing protein n=1 Tax=Solitalea longa TaxID=2079460 RepID=A0A2S5A6F0_9SPHI|nr:helix-turn-helix domain-containing protein [Solitalea longa]POY37889.1 hypothetical protein C3K47_04995 [Solitalea longa]